MKAETKMKTKTKTKSKTKAKTKTSKKVTAKTVKKVAGKVATRAPKKAAVKARSTRAQIVAEHAIDGVERIAGVTHDGERVWCADATRGGLVAVDPDTGRTVKRLIDVPTRAGTAFDGAHLYQIAGGRISKVDRASGAILASIPAPGEMTSGLTFAAGALWVGDYDKGCIRKIDPETGRVLKTIRTERFVTGVTWSDGDLWHGTDRGKASDIRRIDAESGEVLERLELPEGVQCSGLEADGEGRLWFGDRASGTVRAVKTPKVARGRA